MKQTKALIESLSAVGLSGVESEVYLALLREPGATGYRLAQVTGKLAANVYKALDTLRAKGAAVVDESSGPRAYAAVPIREYISRRRRELDDRQEEIERELEGLPAEVAEQGIYRLTTAEQVYERCRAMLASAASVALVDAFPRPLAVLDRAVRAAAKRGVAVWVKTYRPSKVPGCEVVAPEGEEPQLRIWNGDWLNVVVDSGESVQALLRKDDEGVHAAAWCRNRYLAMLDYNGMTSEFLITRVMQLLAAGAAAPAVDREVKRLSARFLKYETFLQQTPDSWLTDLRPPKARKASRTRRKGGRRGATA